MSVRASAEIASLQARITELEAAAARDRNADAARIGDLQEQHRRQVETLQAQHADDMARLAQDMRKKAAISAFTHT